MSTLAKSAERDGLAKSMVVLRVNYLRLNLLLSPKPLRCVITVPTCTSQKAEYLGRGGLALKMPFKSLVTAGCTPTLTPSTASCTDEIAD